MCGLFKSPSEKRKELRKKNYQKRKETSAKSNLKTNIKISKERIDRYGSWAKDGGKFPTKKQLNDMIADENSKIRKARLQQMAATGSKLAKNVKALGGGPLTFITALFSAKPLGADETPENIRKMHMRHEQAKNKKGPR